MIGRAPFAVVIDANALYPFTLRDTFLRAAADGLCPFTLRDTLLRLALITIGEADSGDEGPRRRVELVGTAVTAEVAMPAR